MDDQLKEPARKPEMSERSERLRTVAETLSRCPGNTATPLPSMTFAEIMSYILGGCQVSRAKINGAVVFLAKGAAIEYVTPDNHFEKVAAGDQLLILHRGKLHPLALDSGDLLGKDWYVVTFPQQ